MARKTHPLRTATDSPKMRDCIDWCLAQRIDFVRTSPHQIKVQHLNYYPDREAIQFDGKKKLPVGTFEKFKNLALQNREWRRGQLGKFAPGLTDE
ncbi:MAG: hypothetical protein ACOVQ0_00935 [Novosphingobium sp.]|uniref:hypothetical protein n=1 Tax=Novosphingobium sp. TaxID=1874826 RepID=UPI003B9DBE23